jgi:hypothetical protein
VAGVRELLPPPPLPPLLLPLGASPQQSLLPLQAAAAVGDTAPPAEDEDVDLHFIAFVCSDGGWPRAGGAWAAHFDCSHQPRDVVPAAATSP